MLAVVTYHYVEVNSSPGLGELSFDVADQTAPASLYVNTTTQPGAEIGGLWASLVPGNTIELGDPSASIDVQRYRVGAGSPTVVAGVITLPVVWSFGGGAITPGALVTVEIDAPHVVGIVAPPTIDDVAAYLSINAAQRTSEIDAMLTEDLATSLDYELSRADTGLLVADGASPPGQLPSAMAHAIKMRAAATYRRRNSINGFDGYADLGTVPVRASDPDIERYVDRWRAWAWA